MSVEVAADVDGGAELEEHGLGHHDSFGEKAETGDFFFGHEELFFFVITEEEFGD